MKDEKLNGFKTIGEWKKMDMKPLEFVKTNTSFDRPNGGLLKGGLTVITGASGDGKSFSTIHLASALSKSNYVLYISAENDIRIDLERFYNCTSEYDTNDDNIMYFNTLYSELNSAELHIDMYKMLEQLAPSFDVIIMDAWQNISNANDGGQMYADGNDICQKLCKIANKTDTAIVLSWQLKNGNKGKSIYDISIDDISVSVGVARYATSVWVVKRIPPHDDKDGKHYEDNWKMALIKSRVNWDTRYSVIDVLKEQNKFSLKGPSEETVYAKFIKGIDNEIN